MSKEVQPAQPPVFLNVTNEALPARALLDGEIRFSLPHATQTQKFSRVRAGELSQYLERQRQEFHACATAVVTVSRVRIK